MLKMLGSYNIFEVVLELMLSDLLRWVCNDVLCKHGASGHSDVYAEFLCSQLLYFFCFFL